MDESRLQHMLDRIEIADTVARFALSMDTRDWAAFRACFADRVELDVTSFSGGSPQHMSGDEFTEMIRKAVGGFQSTQHMNTSHVVTVSGDEATCQSHVQAQHYLPTSIGSSYCTVGGIYTNTLVRTPQGWRVRLFKLTVLWTEGNRGIFEEAAQRGAGK